ncbi:hypothetical protein MD588_03065 [Photobacterium sp. SDRW27]|uniref:hypothetical protein n=1 Tax=Photobacterium obscurum TaxID=2829490 RepID=UPI002244C689|nr:hypothetical protein [Photobacterium obscurum]MCW8327776.1 hypothetical protein [Photobacterium obscurum]
MAVNQTNPVCSHLKSARSQAAGSTDRNQRMSMHEGVAPWCDCCVCEAEPYWADVAEEMGISLSNFEEDRQ